MILKYKKKLQLRIGGRYRDRQGNIVTIEREVPRSQYTLHGYYWYTSSTVSYTNDGKYFDFKDSVRDLVEEVK